MADVFFKKETVLAGEYWRLYGVKNVKPEERNSLGLDCQEYFAVSGDIGSSIETVNKSLEILRDEMKKDGHILHFK